MAPLGKGKRGGVRVGTICDPFLGRVTGVDAGPPFMGLVLWVGIEMFSHGVHA